MCPLFFYWGTRILDRASHYKTKEDGSVVLEYFTSSHYNWFQNIFLLNITVDFRMSTSSRYNWFQSFTSFLYDSILNFTSSLYNTLQNVLPVSLCIHYLSHVRCVLYRSLYTRHVHVYIRLTTTHVTVQEEMTTLIAWCITLKQTKRMISVLWVWLFCYLRLIQALLVQLTNPLDPHVHLLHPSLEGKPCPGLYSLPLYLQTTKNK